MENIHAVYNGRFNFLNDIKISPLSRAYTFSDSVYEVIPFCNSNIIAFDKHITRLKNSCDSLSFKADVNKISSEILDLINNISVSYIDKLTTIQRKLFDLLKPVIQFRNPAIFWFTLTRSLLSFLELSKQTKNHFFKNCPSFLCCSYLVLKMLMT